MAWCVVNGCFNNINKFGITVSFHRYPDKEKEPGRYKAWFAAKGRKELPATGRVCSDHFAEDAFCTSYDMKMALCPHLYGSRKERRKLKAHVVPSIFPHNIQPPIRHASVRRAQIKEKREILNEAMKAVHSDNDINLAESQTVEISNEGLLNELKMKTSTEKTSGHEINTYSQIRRKAIALKALEQGRDLFPHLHKQRLLPSLSTSSPSENQTLTKNGDQICEDILSETEKVKEKIKEKVKKANSRNSTHIEALELKTKTSTIRLSSNDNKTNSQRRRKVLGIKGLEQGDFFLHEQQLRSSHSTFRPSENQNIIKNGDQICEDLSSETLKVEKASTEEAIPVEVKTKTKISTEKLSNKEVKTYPQRKRKLVTVKGLEQGRNSLLNLYNYKKQLHPSHSTSRPSENQNITKTSDQVCEGNSSEILKTHSSRLKKNLKTKTSTIKSSSKEVKTYSQRRRKVVALKGLEKSDFLTPNSYKYKKRLRSSHDISRHSEDQNLIKNGDRICETLKVKKANTKKSRPKKSLKTKTPTEKLSNKENKTNSQERRKLITLNRLTGERDSLLNLCKYTKRLRSSNSSSRTSENQNLIETSDQICKNIPSETLTLNTTNSRKATHAEAIGSVFITPLNYSYSDSKQEEKISVTKVMSCKDIKNKTDEISSSSGSNSSYVVSESRRSITFGQKEVNRAVATVYPVTKSTSVVPVNSRIKSDTRTLPVISSHRIVVANKTTNSSLPRKQHAVSGNTTSVLQHCVSIDNATKSSSTTIVQDNINNYSNSQVTLSDKNITPSNLQLSYNQLTNLKKLSNSEVNVIPYLKTSDILIPTLYLNNCKTFSSDKNNSVQGASAKQQQNADTQSFTPQVAYSKQTPLTISELPCTSTNLDSSQFCENEDSKTPVVAKKPQPLTDSDVQAILAGYNNQEECEDTCKNTPELMSISNSALLHCDDKAKSVQSAQIVSYHNNNKVFEDTTKNSDITCNQISQRNSTVQTTSYQSNFGLCKSYVKSPLVSSSVQSTPLISEEPKGIQSDSSKTYSGNKDVSSNRQQKLPNSDIKTIPYLSISKLCNDNKTSMSVTSNTQHPTDTDMQITLNVDRSQTGQINTESTQVASNGQRIIPIINVQGNLGRSKTCEDDFKNIQAVSNKQQLDSGVIVHTISAVNLDSNKGRDSIIKSLQMSANRQQTLPYLERQTKPNFDKNELNKNKINKNNIKNVHAEWKRQQAIVNTSTKALSHDDNKGKCGGSIKSSLFATHQMSVPKAALSHSHDKAQSVQIVPYQENDKVCEDTTTKNSQNESKEVSQTGSSKQLPLLLNSKVLPYFIISEMPTGNSSQNASDKKVFIIRKNNDKDIKLTPSNIATMVQKGPASLHKSVFDNRAIFQNSASTTRLTIKGNEVIQNDKNLSTDTTKSREVTQNDKTTTHLTITGNEVTQNDKTGIHSTTERSAVIQNSNIPIHLASNACLVPVTPHKTDSSCSLLTATVDSNRSNICKESEEVIIVDEVDSQETCTPLKNKVLLPIQVSGSARTNGIKPYERDNRLRQTGNNASIVRDNNASLSSTKQLSLSSLSLSMERENYNNNNQTVEQKDNDSNNNETIEQNNNGNNNNQSKQKNDLADVVHVDTKTKETENETTSEQTPSHTSTRTKEKDTTGIIRIDQRIASIVNTVDKSTRKRRTPEKPLLTMTSKSRYKPQNYDINGYAKYVTKNTVAAKKTVVQRPRKAVQLSDFADNGSKHSNKSIKSPTRRLQHGQDKEMTSPPSNEKVSRVLFALDRLSKNPSLWETEALIVKVRDHLYALRSILSKERTKQRDFMDSNLDHWVKASVEYDTNTKKELTPAQKLLQKFSIDDTSIQTNKITQRFGKSSSNIPQRKSFEDVIKAQERRKEIKLQLYGSSTSRSQRGNKEISDEQLQDAAIGNINIGSPDKESPVRIHNQSDALSKSSKKKYSNQPNVSSRSDKKRQSSDEALDANQRKKKRPSEIDQLTDTHWNESWLKDDHSVATNDSRQQRSSREQRKLHYAMARFAELEQSRAMKMKENQTLGDASGTTPLPVNMISPRKERRLKKISDRDREGKSKAGTSQWNTKEKVTTQGRKIDSVNSKQQYALKAKKAAIKRHVDKKESDFVKSCQPTVKLNKLDMTKRNSMSTSSSSLSSSHNNSSQIQKKEYLLVPKYNGFKDFTPIVVESRTRHQRSEVDRERLEKQQFPLMVVEKLGSVTKEVLIQKGEDKEKKVEETSRLIQEQIENNNKKKTVAYAGRTSSGETILHRAARVGQVDVTEECLREGYVDVNACDNAGWTALHEAVIHGRTEVARVLLKYGANPNCYSNSGARPLHDAVEKNHMDCIRLLISYGGDLGVASYTGAQPVDLAKSEELTTFVQQVSKDLSSTDALDEDDTWRFQGSCSALDTVDCSGIFHDTVTSLPIAKKKKTTDNQVDFFMTPREMPQTYYLPYKDDTGVVMGYRNYFLLNELLERLSMSRNAFTKHFKAEIVTMLWLEFEKYVKANPLNSLPSLPGSSRESPTTIEIVSLGLFTLKKRLKNARLMKI